MVSAGYFNTYWFYCDDKGMYETMLAKNVCYILLPKHLLVDHHYKVNHSRYKCIFIMIVLYFEKKKSTP